MLVMFGKVLSFEFLPVDDDLYVFGQATTGWFEASWRERLLTPSIGYPTPLPTALHAVVFRFFGATPGAFHALNLVFHFGTVLLLAPLLRLLVGEWRAATMVTALWAFHPIAAEPVAWISQLKDVVMTFGVVAAALGTAQVWSGRRWGWGLVLLGTLVALASKPTGVVVGPLLGVMVLAHVEQGARRRALLVFAGAATLLGLLVTFASYDEHSRFGGHAGETDRIARMVAAAFQQVQNVVVPVDLAPRYPFKGAPFEAWPVIIFLTALIGFAAAKWRTAAPTAAFGLAWLVLAYAPTSNVIPLARFTSVSYGYLPTIGLAIVGAHWLANAERRRGRLHAGFVVALVVLSFGAVRSLEVYRNGASLTWEMVQREPDDGFARMKFAQVLYLAGKYEDAREVFESSNPELYGTVLPFPPRWPLSYCRLGETERCDELFAVALNRPAPEETSAAREFQYIADAWAAELRAEGRDVPSGLPELADERLRAAMRAAAEREAP